ncbi:MAG: ankyrin repeat domain-containing protein, partial [Proteobacteria bacterium]|nr:ankyrin repeat domain-containing protein [Pseudomonadota bacterium]
NGHTGTVKLLLENGADPNNQTSTGTTPLIGAAISGHTEIIKYLIDYEADPHFKGPLGKASGLAQSKGHTEAYKILIEAEND